MADEADPSQSRLVSAYLEKRDNLLRFFTMRAGSLAEAEEIVQEMYLRIGVRDDSAIENPIGYLYRLGTNVMFDRARSRNRAIVRDDAYYQAVQGNGGGEPEADAPSPEAAWAARSRLERVLATIEKMPPQRRRAFVMHKIDGLSHADIADTLRISRSAVEKLIIAGLRDLAAGEG